MSAGASPQSISVSANFLEFLRSEGAIDEPARLRVNALLQSSHQPVDTILLELGIVPENRLADLLASYLGLQRIHPQEFPDEMPVELPNSWDFCRSNAIIPIACDGSTVTVATARPLEADAIRGFAFALARQPVARVASLSDITKQIERLAANENPQTSAVASETTAQEEDVERLKDSAREAPIIKLLNRLIGAATEQSASDIHIEPLEDHVQVRYRIDGALQTVERLPKSVQSGLVSRVKILAKLNIAEQRLPQDGRIRIPVRGRDIEFRVSTSPVAYGETVALRVLDKQELPLQFRELGFTHSETETIHHLIRNPNGILLVTGPTGSGKTTTLYAALNALNKPEVKLFTVEDPVEYNLKGVNQINVKPSIGLDFAAVLRSILRQDPDIIMIGEIRDLETARIAIQASLTGHLVLSTLHTNSAAASVTRLLDMGVEDYLLASCLRGVVAQRLLRRLCPHCKNPVRPAAALVQKLPILAGAKLHEAKGCSHCRGTGYLGRTIAAEIMTVEAPVQDAIVKRAPESDLQTLAQESGMSTLFGSGLRLASEGETSLDEVFRVIQSPGAVT